jgi:hypothetical protein
MNQDAKTDAQITGAISRIGSLAHDFEVASGGPVLGKSEPFTISGENAARVATDLRTVLSALSALRDGEATEGTIRIKPLQWVPNSQTVENSLWVSVEPLGRHYTIEPESHVFRVETQLVMSEYGADALGLYPTLDAAKAAAQADLERRVSPLIEVAALTRNAEPVAVRRDTAGLIEEYRNLVKTGAEYAASELRLAPTSAFEIYMGHFRDIGRDIEAALSATPPVAQTGTVGMTLDEIWADATNSVCQTMQDKDMCNCPAGGCVASKVVPAPEDRAYFSRTVGISDAMVEAFAREFTAVNTSTWLERNREDVRRALEAALSAPTVEGEGL